MPNYAFGSKRVTNVCAAGCGHAIAEPSLKLLIMKGLMLVWLQLLAYTEPRVQKPVHNID
jgi:hypothetical protein